MASISKNSLVIIFVVVAFLIIDLILSVFIIIESNKYNKCRNNESNFCLEFSCPYPYDSTYKPFTATNNRLRPPLFDVSQQQAPDPSIAGNCFGYPYRLIDPNGELTDSNIECRIPSTYGTGTQKATTLLSPS